MLGGLIDGNLARAVADKVGEDRLAELRLRVGRAPLAVATDGRRIRFADAYRVSRADLDKIVLGATNMSLYTVSEELLQGYIPACGVRIGVGGEGVNDGGKLIGVKNIGYLVIRVPHQIKTAADGVIDRVLSVADDGADVKSTLVISPPRGGKTTMLRELARRISGYKSVVVIDERYELACVVDGAPTLDVGDSEVISGVKKCVAYENALRAMSPEVLVTDELFRREEVEMILDAMRAGVKAIASVHAPSLDSLKNSAVFAPLAERFELAIELGVSPIGQVRAVREL